MSDDGNDLRLCRARHKRDWTKLIGLTVWLECHRRVERVRSRSACVHFPIF